MDLSLDDLRETTLTEAITANLRVVREDNCDLEHLERLERQTGKIVAYLRAIRALCARRPGRRRYAHMARELAWGLAG
jgi:hypothetical protein